MKATSVIIIAVTAAIFCAVSARIVAPNGVNLDNLKKDLLDFKNILPLDKIRSIYVKHLNYDAEFKKALEFLKSDQFKVVANKIANSKEHQAIIDYLVDQGWVERAVLMAFLDDSEELIDQSTEQIDENEFQSFRARLSPRSVEDLVDEVLAVLPKAELSKLVKEKLSTSPDFRALFKTVTSPELKKLVSDLLNAPELRGEYDSLAENGVDLHKIAQKVKAFVKN